MEELSNPLGTFIEDTLVLDDKASISKDDLYHVFKRWATARGIHPGTDLTFKRQFLAATSDKPIRITQTSNGESRVRVYQGIRFQERAQQYVDSVNNSLMSEDFL